MLNNAINLTANTCGVVRGLVGSLVIEIIKAAVR